MTVLNAILFAALAFLASFVALGAAFSLARGKAAAMRHLIWTGAFAALLALPLAALLLPSQWVWDVAPAATIQPVTDPATVIASASEPEPFFDAAELILAAAVLWLCGVLFHAGKMLTGSAALIVLYRRSVPHIPERLDTTAFRGLNWQLRLRTSPNDCGPVTWGVFKPVVLLPKSSVTWPRERLLSVLLHEAAHVRRRDCLARLIALAAAALYWPNPLVWMALRRMRCDAERAADDAVLSAGVKPTRYAEHLIGLAGVHRSASFTAVTLSMAERSTLEPRVKAILDSTQPRCGVTPMDMLKIALLGAAATCVLALVRPSFADSSAPAVEPAGVSAGVPGEAVQPAPLTEPVTAKHGLVRTVDDGNMPRTVVLKIADAGAPGAPSVPDVPAVAAVADAPPAPPVADAPPAPPAPPAPGDVLTEFRTEVRVELSDADKAAIRQAASAETRRAMAQARRALAAAHIDQVVADAMKKAMEALGKAKISHDEAMAAVADAKIDAKIEEALQKAEEAMKKAERGGAKTTRVFIHRTVDGNGNVTEETRTED